MEKPKRSGYIIAIVVVALLAAIPTMIFAAYIYSNIVNATQHASMVDVSSIAQLSEEQVGRIEEAIVKLGDADLISEPRIEEFDENHTLMRVYDMDWTDNEISSYQAFIMIFVSIYRQEETAISVMQATRIARDFQPHTDIVNDNNTEALLRYPVMPASVSGWFMPSNDRIVNSELRIGDVVITLWETRHRSDTRELLSNQFIEILVETLQEE